MVITISRECGSGGHEIGLRLAKKLNIDFYDKSILGQLAAARGFSAESTEFLEETGRDGNHAVRNFFDFRIADRNELKQLIQEIASKGDCVIVGRCADHLFGEQTEGVVSFFIHADEEIKIARLMERHGISADAAKRHMHQIDGERKAYFEYFTGKEWRDCRSYHFSVDSGYLGLNGCVESIAALLGNRRQVSECFD